MYPILFWDTFSLYLNFFFDHSFFFHFLLDNNFLLQLFRCCRLMTFHFFLRPFYRVIAGYNGREKRRSLRKKK